MENKFGKDSVLNVSSKLKDGKAILDNIYFTAPFKIMNPFRTGSTSLTVMILSASAGIMEGDIQDISIEVGEGTNLKFTSQSYEKIHRMQGGQAKRVTKIKVCKNSSINYMPFPTIPFKDSSFISELNIELEDSSSKLILSEVLSCGRAGCGEVFEYLLYKNLVNIKEGGSLIYRDNTMFSPKEMNMNGIGMYEGYTHFANMLICNYSISEEDFFNIREILNNYNDIDGDITKTNYGDFAIRILGSSGEKLTKVCEEIIEKYIL